MYRKPGCLIPLETTILAAAKMFQQRGKKTFYGYEFKWHIASHIQNGIYGGYRGAATGTIYRALIRLEKMGYLESYWEDLPLASNSKPRRRMYSLKKGINQRRKEIIQ